MQPTPTAEHAWLMRLAGSWTMESECVMGPGQDAMKSSGTEVVRSLGGLWTIGQGEGKSPDGTAVTSIMTLGFDPKQQKFVGSFIASCMTHLWPYLGTLDAAGKILTLNSEGPGFSEDGSYAKYQDIFEFLTEDHRTLRSRYQQPDGNWYQFMEAHYRRVKT